MIKNKNKMAKIQLTESDVIQIVEEATKQTISKLLNERGATMDAMRLAYHGGKELPDDDMSLDSWKDLADINGNYDEYIANKNAYIDAKEKNNADKAKFNSAMDDRDSYATSTLKDLKKQELTSRKDRYNKAIDQVGSRPGIAGAASRAGVYGAARVGQGVGKIKKGVNNFIHNKLGFEE